MTKITDQLREDINALRHEIDSVREKLDVIERQYSVLIQDLIQKIETLSSETVLFSKECTHNKVQRETKRIEEGVSSILREPEASAKGSVTFIDTNIESESKKKVSQRLAGGKQKKESTKRKIEESASAQTSAAKKTAEHADQQEKTSSRDSKQMKRSITIAPLEQLRVENYLSDAERKSLLSNQKFLSIPGERWTQLCSTFFLLINEIYDYKCICGYTFVLSAALTPKQRLVFIYDLFMLLEDLSEVVSIVASIIPDGFDVQSKLYDAIKVVVMQQNVTDAGTEREERSDAAYRHLMLCGWLPPAALCLNDQVKAMYTPETLFRGPIVNPHAFDCAKGIELLCTVIDWDWTYNTYIVEELWPSVCRGESLALYVLVLLLLSARRLYSTHASVNLLDARIRSLEGQGEFGRAVQKAKEMLDK